MGGRFWGLLGILGRGKFDYKDWISAFKRVFAFGERYIFSVFSFPVTAQYVVITLSSPPELKQSW